ncbi:MAG: TonB-dependent receptor plug domain-containing protein [Treponema sp.]|jgi:iron complex outermembrane receptor protein|nr:TonB-dependent receptor plug domain-containing protein [Treponema sp.]
MMKYGTPVLRLLLLAVLIATVSAEEEAEPETAATEASGDDALYVLPEAEVSAEQDTPDRITREEMDRDGASDLWEAVRYTPGVILSGGGRRNDSNFSVRGYGTDSVPIYVDGILMANPYRGEGDSARFLTGDLEGIEIAKGYSSELLGANALGGVILLRTAKPRQALELSLKTGFGLDSIFNYADSTHVLELGTKQPFFYGKGVFQYRDVNHYRLPDSFEPSPQNPQEKGNRLWSDSKDLKFTLIGGLTPGEDLDIWLTYVYQNADKGLSPPDVGIKEYAIWDWPVWNRHSVSLNSSWGMGTFSLEGLFYFAKYDNRLDEYYNYKAFELGIHAPHSDYDEYTLGGRLTGGWEINARNTVQAALTYKKEDHRGLRGGSVNEDERIEEMHVNEDTWSLGAEYTLNPWSPLTIKAGLGFDALVPQEYWNDENEYNQLLGADYFIVQSRNMFLYTWQLGVFYRLPWGNPEAQSHELRLAYARKNHFPTMSQRYSTRFGSTLPNPHLGPERANHFELGYRGYLGREDAALGFSLNAALYYSAMAGKIVSVELGNPHYPSASVEYSRNLDRINFWGLELAPDFTLQDWLTIGLAFSLNNYHIDHPQDGIKVLSYYPPITLNGYAVVQPLAFLSIIPRLEYMGSRYGDTEGTDLLEGYVLAHIKITIAWGNYVSVSAELDNILDTYYEIRRYSPQGGRSLNLMLTVKYK